LRQANKLLTAYFAAGKVPLQANHREEAPMTTEDLPEAAPRPGAAKSLAVEGAFTTLIQSLRTEALEPGADYERCVGYLRKVEALAIRWKDGEMAHGLRGQKGAVS